MNDNYAFNKPYPQDKWLGEYKKLQEKMGSIVRWFLDQGNKDLRLTAEQVAYILVNFDPKAEYITHYKRDDWNKRCLKSMETK